MEIHWLDIIVYIIGLIIILFLLPEDYKEGLGSMFGLFIIIVYSFIYITAFAFCGLNIIDIWNSINIKNSL